MSDRLFLLFFLLFAIRISAQQYLDSIVRIQGVNADITLDGILDEPFWQEVASFQFFEYRPNWGAKDTLTTMYVTFNNDNLLVGFKANMENPEELVARNLLRDGYYGDDYFAFQIDPNRTKKNSFAFSAYPTGARYDASTSNNNIPLGWSSPGNRAYDMLWKGEVKVTENGWQGEYQIPLSNLRFEVRDGVVAAGISGHRSIQHRNKNILFPQIPRKVQGGEGMPSLKQPVVFEGLVPKKDLQITPYVLGNLATSYDPGGQSGFQKNKTNRLDAGLDVRYGLTPSLTLDATLNTDFSQVEIDDQVVNLNRFSIFLPERRKFFQEQAGLFDFSLGILSQLFYSRTIGISNGRPVPILGGLRLTGELGDWDLGALSLQTEGTYVDDTSLPSENFSVLRLRKKIFNDRSFLGIMATNRIRKGYFNTALGIDGLVDLGNDNFLIGSAASMLEGEDYGQTPFHFFDQSRFALRWEKRKLEGWFYKGSYEYSGAHFNPGMGFQLRERNQNFYTGLYHGKFIDSKEDGFFQYRRWRVINTDLYTSPDLGEIQSWNQRPEWMGRFFSGNEISAFGQLQYEFLQAPLVFSEKTSIPEGHYLFSNGGLSFAPGIQRELKLPTSIQYGQFFDGTNLQLQVSPEWNVNRHLTLDGSWRVNYLSFKKRNVSEWIYIPQLRINWAVNLHLSGSITAQYNSLADRIFTNARLRYNFKDGHDLYIVYNQDYNSMRSSGLMPRPYYNDRIFTLKYSYTFIR